MEPRAPAVVSVSRPAIRLAVEVSGAVQGVGFRPFVFRLATGLGLSGWVSNDPRGVTIEVEGDPDSVAAFVEKVRDEAPPLASVDAVRVRALPPTGAGPFEIRESRSGDAPTAVVLADAATCPECLAEVSDPADRRHRYPFANCTRCGPRFTIVTGLPYDRPNTTMRGFALCDECRREYEDPRDRRFHAQPIACPRCGPRLSFLGTDGREAAAGHEALLAGARVIRDGGILALLGLGGFLLLCDAGREEAVARLRRRKAREEKPLAVMATDLDGVRAVADVSAAEAALLGSPAAPIVLLRRKPTAPLAPAVAPSNPYVGVMLPSSPLHHLLMRELGRPVVATSGNRTDEPICTTTADALERLAGIADAWLTHDRPVARHVDDSVVAVVEGAPYLLRRARGYAPMPVRLRRNLPVVLGVGGHLKATVSLSVGERVFVSQHLSDLDTPLAREAFERVVRDFLDMYGAIPEAIVHDLHPDYASTRWATEAGHRPGAPDWVRRLAEVPRLAVQHHHAHLASCLADAGEDGRALGVTWDGTGLGTDDTIWGGEFLLGNAAGFERVASLRPFRLPGGDRAAREPRRSALALLWEALGEGAWGVLPRRLFGDAEKPVLERMLSSGVHAPVTTSAGRLFDGVAALLGLHAKTSFEGQGAMSVEFAADPEETATYPVPVSRRDRSPVEVDWRPAVLGVVEDVRRGVPTRTVAGRFHATLVEAIASVAGLVGERRVALSGGCFQNRVLLERTRARLVREGFDVLVHRRVPANDGGLSLGQVVVAAARAGTEGRT